jgi:hypothetical protein
MPRLVACVHPRLRARANRRRARRLELLVSVGQPVLHVAIRDGNGGSCRSQAPARVARFTLVRAGPVERPDEGSPPARERGLGDAHAFRCSPEMELLGEGYDHRW